MSARLNGTICLLTMPNSSFHLHRPDTRPDVCTGSFRPPPDSARTVVSDPPPLLAPSISARGTPPRSLEERRMVAARPRTAGPTASVAHVKRDDTVPDKD